MNYRKRKRFWRISNNKTFIAGKFILKCLPFNSNVILMPKANLGTSMVNKPNKYVKYV